MGLVRARADPLVIGAVLVICAVVLARTASGKAGASSREDRLRVQLPILGTIAAEGRVAVVVAFLLLGAAGVVWGVTLLADAGSIEELSEDAVSATATREHAPDRGITYEARNTLDRNPNTGWNGVGSCIGCRLRYDFGRPRKLKSVSLVNGYAKDAAAFRGNDRVKKVRFVMSDDRQFARTLRDTDQVQDIKGRFGTISALTIEVVSVYIGTNEPGLRDAALTDIQFFE